MLHHMQDGSGTSACSQEAPIPLLCYFFQVCGNGCFHECRQSVKAGLSIGECACGHSPAQRAAARLQNQGCTPFNPPASLVYRAGAQLTEWRISWEGCNPDQSTQYSIKFIWAPRTVVATASWAATMPLMEATPPGLGSAMAAASCWMPSTSELVYCEASFCTSRLMVACRASTSSPRLPRRPASRDRQVELERCYWRPGALVLDGGGVAAAALWGRRCCTCGGG